MTAITLELPDELAARLERLRPHLPQLLQRLLGGAQRTTAPATRPAASAYGEMLDFLARSPSSAEIIAFKVSGATQTRLEALLDKNREGELSPEESAELDTFQQVNHLLSMLKARARRSPVTP